MRPVRLTVQAFGPYPEREVIDFRDAVEAGLFGIYGQTGSGKSTIFSAMTFALFGEPSKSEQEAPSLRSDHADPGVPTEVEFVFDIGGRRFVVLRRPDQVRPRQRGVGETRNAHEAYLFDATGMAPDEITEKQRGKVVAERKVREVDGAIADMLGYGSEQFRQIVLLPQGRFETFLSARTRERLEILRDLFDVSLYRALMADLKTEAEAAERHVREERELCARQLLAEGFESTDALAAGIEDAETRHARLLEDEERARAGFEAAQSALREAEAVEEKFSAVEKAEAVLAELRTHEADMEAVAERMTRAERARSLLDVEAGVVETNREVVEAEGKLREAEEAAGRRRDMAASAAEALRKEMDRAGDMDELRRKIETFDRFGEILDRAEGSTGSLREAEAAEQQATRDFDAAQRGLAELQATRREKGEALKAARQSETRRTEIAARIACLTASHAAAGAYEKAGRDVLRARSAVETQTSAHEAASRRADEARLGVEEAERSLSAAQALHLASKLRAGLPCPVCGATEHPAPATGTIENAGLDRAFREARIAWQQADGASRTAAEALAGLKSALAEREDVLASLERPDESGESLAEGIEAERSALAGLGPEVDVEAAEAEIDGFEKELARLERNRDKLREAVAELRQETAKVAAMRDGMLSPVPEAMRDPDALAAARVAASRDFADLHAAKVAAEKAATETRDAALGAEKDREAAAQLLSNWRERHHRAGEAFQARLCRAGLSVGEFRDLKPAIDTLEADRETVGEYRRRLQGARDAAATATAAIETLSRPDIPLLVENRSDAAQEVSEATELRIGASNRVDRLTRLRDSLAETMRRLDEAEVASGPLRGLAALANGSNPQKLNLETFAIGAMFDRVLEAANLRLVPMTSGRYRLERDLEGAGRGSRGLGIQAFDLHTGKSRPTTTLSGGETFIAALALALGLADVVESTSGKVRLDTIFIDEGFGSLDTENGSGTLDQVLQALGSLVSRNRAVGLISHVPLVQEAIPNGFYVRKGLAGSSVEKKGPI